LNNGGFLVHLIDWEIEMRQKPETSKDAADKLVKNIRRKTRQTYSAEEKIRIVLAGLRGEESIAALCRREGIAESLYYSWSKCPSGDFENRRNRLADFGLRVVRGCDSFCAFESRKEAAMWTIENRGRYDRSKLRYPSDLSDEEWAIVEPLIPAGKRGGGKRTVVLREVVNGLMYVLSTGCQWRAVPKDLPPRSTLFGYFDLWNWDGTLGRMHAELYVKCREAMGRQASPTAAIIDSQSVKSAEKGGLASTRAGMMRGKRSRARNGISLSIQ